MLMLPTKKNGGNHLGASLEEFTGGCPIAHNLMTVSKFERAAPIMQSTLTFQRPTYDGAQCRGKGRPESKAGRDELFSSLAAPSTAGLETIDFIDQRSKAGTHYGRPDPKANVEELACIAK